MRSISTFLRCAVAAVLTAGAGVLLATAPAAAAPDAMTIEVTCRAGSGDPVIIEREVTLSPGQVLRVTTSGCNSTGISDGLAGTYLFSFSQDSTELVVPPTLGGIWPLLVGSSVEYTAPDHPLERTFQFSVVYVYNGYGDVIWFNITVCDDGVCPTSVEPAPVPMWNQAVGRVDADAGCPDGWDASWAHWPNGGTGGFVCVRSVPAIGAG